MNLNRKKFKNTALITKRNVEQQKFFLNIAKLLNENRFKHTEIANFQRKGTQGI